jgi:hypothetical protein
MVQRLVENNTTGLRGILPPIDFGRIKFFVEFWGGDFQAPAWLKYAVDILRKAQDLQTVSLPARFINTILNGPRRQIYDDINEDSNGKHRIEDRNEDSNGKHRIEDRNALSDPEYKVADVNGEDLARSSTQEAILKQGNSKSKDAEISQEGQSYGDDHPDINEDSNGKHRIEDRNVLSDPEYKVTDVNGEDLSSTQEAILKQGNSKSKDAEISQEGQSYGDDVPAEAEKHL